MASNRTWRPYTKTVRPARGGVVLQSERTGARWKFYRARVLDTSTAEIDGTVMVEYAFPWTGRASVNIGRLKVLRLPAKKS